MGPIRTLSPLILGIALCAAARADDSAWSYVGGAGTFTKNTQIQMVSESVHLTLADGVSHVHAVFHFRNHGGATRVQMAFPERYWHGNTKPSIRHFRSWVDGRRTRVTPQQPTHEKDADGEDWGYQRAWVKSVRFAPHGRRTVVVDYDALNGDTILGQSQGYILASGASWRGVIERCRVTVDWSQTSGEEPTIMLRGHDRVWSPELRDHKRRTLVWKNLKPDFDIQCDWNPRGYTFFVNREWNDLGLVPNHPLQFIIGDQRNPFVAVSALLNFDERYDDLDHDEFGLEAIRRPMLILGRRLNFPDPWHIAVDGRRVRLSSRIRKDQPQDEDGGDDIDYIRLRDVVRALGGSYRYDPDSERTYITVSTRKERKRSPK